MSLSVKKVDGQLEPYIHTRVMATISAAISEVGCYDEQTVNALADAVRMYIEDCRDENVQSSVVSSDEIYSMILATLEETGLIRAAEALKQHRVSRQIKRSRQLILHCLKNHLPEDFCDGNETDCCVSKKGFTVCDEDSCICFSLEPWDKSRLANSLVKNYKMNNPAARSLSGSIEEKIFRLEMSVIRSELIHQLILNEFYYLRKHEAFFESTQRYNRHHDQTSATEIHEVAEKTHPNVTSNERNKA